MTPDDLRQDIELKVVELLKDLLAKGKITDAKAQTMSQRVLDIIKPGMSFEELYRAVPQLDDTMPELAPIVVPIVREYEMSIVQQAQLGVSDLIRQGQYDAAAKLAKNAINKDVKLEWTGSGKP